MIVCALTSNCELQERTASRRASVSAYSSVREVHDRVLVLLLLALVDDVELKVDVGNVVAVEVLEKHALTLSVALVLGFTKLVAHRPTILGAQGFARHTALGLAGHNESDDDDAADTSIEHALGAHDSARMPLAHTSGIDELLLVVVVVVEVVVVASELIVDRMEVVLGVVVVVVVLHAGVPRTRVLQSGEPLAFTHQQRPVRRLHWTLSQAPALLHLTNSQRYFNSLYNSGLYSTVYSLHLQYIYC